LLRAGGLLLPRVPVRLAYAIAGVVGAAGYALARPARRAIDENLDLALPSVPRSVRRRVALAAFRHDARNWVDTLRIPTLDPAKIPEMLDISGWDELEAAYRAGRGVVLAMIHLGNFDLVGQFLAIRHLPLSVPVERMQPERLYDYLVALRAANGIHLFPVEHASRQLLQALRRGEIVGIAADRQFAGRQTEVELFGRKCTLPRGAAALARRTGAPLFVGVGVRVAADQYRGFLIAVEVDRTMNQEADETIATQRLALIIEQFVRAYPEQWLAFTPVCPEPRAGANAAATIGQQNGAAG
jgi:lauroyl/myristoyl acyltransferase